MSLKERIDNDIKQAMKNKNRELLNVLRVVKGEIGRREDNVNRMNDSEIISLMKKFVKNLKSIGDERSLNEIQILKSYFPEPLTEDEVKSLIEDICLNFPEPLTMRDMGSIISQFNNQYSGRADNKLVADIVKSKINA